MRPSKRSAKYKVFFTPVIANYPHITSFKGFNKQVGEIKGITKSVISVVFERFQEIIGEF